MTEQERLELEQLRAEKAKLEAEKAGKDKDESEGKSIEDKSPSRNELLRELSKEYGVNLFDADGIQAFREFQDTQKTEAEKLKEEIEALKAREKEAQEALQKQKLDTLRIKHNIDETKFNDFLALANAKVNNETSIEQAFEAAVKDYGVLFVPQGQRDGIQVGLEINDGNPGNEEVKSFEDKVLDAYLKNRK